MVKKISAIFLALVLCLTAMVVPASAAVELGDAQMAFSLEWDKESYDAGETAVLSVYMDAADDLSLYTGSFVIGLNSAVISQDDNTLDDIRANSTISEWFAAYYKDGTTNLSWLATTIAPKVDAANTADEQALYDQYIKFTAARNSAGSHENVANSKAGFGGDEFVADEPILTISLIVAADVPDGTVINAAITSGSTTCSPVQTTWKYYKNPGSATTTANIAAANIDVTQTIATATVGEIACPHANTTVTEEVTANPTCTEAGSKTVTTVCNDCNETVSEETVEITATGHSYTSEVTAPTCTEAGYTTYTCACGDTYTADEVAALGHTAGEPVVENATSASCGESGSYDEVVYCSVCKAVMSRETKTVDAVPHAYTSEVTKAPTCTEAGVKTFTCANCGDTYTEAIEATGHSYEAVVTAPTCTEQGYTTYTCACGDTYTADYVDATGHSYTSEETKAPTCTEAGVMTYTCACGDTYTEAIEAKGHALVSVEAKAPTCTAVGYEAYEYCTACDYTTYQEIAANGHNYEENILREPTCTAVGKKNEKCSVCDAVKPSSMTDIPTIPHNYESVVTAPTCTEAGYTTYTCAACGDTYTADEVAATGHTYEVTFVKDPTCAKDGYTTYTCACGDSYKETIPSTNHTNEDGSSALVEIPAVPATCKNPGYTAGMVCTICNTQTVVPALTEKADHAWDNGVVTEPTYTEQGYTTFTCENCGETKKDNFVPALEAEYTVAIRQPSITKIRCMDTIVLHTVVEGSDDYTVVWTADNENFVMTDLGDGKLEITSAENGFTVFTATVYDAAGNEIGSDTVEMQSKADIWGKIGGFFRNLFGSTLYYNY